MLTYFLEFASIILWNLVTEETVKSVENIQMRFLKFIYLNAFQYYPFSILYSELHISKFRNA